MDGVTEQLAECRMLKPCHCGEPFKHYSVMSDELICVGGHRLTSMAYYDASVTVAEYMKGARPSKEHLWPAP